MLVEALKSCKRSGLKMNNLKRNFSKPHHMHQGLQGVTLETRKLLKNSMPRSRNFHKSLREEPCK